MNTINLGRKKTSFIFKHLLSLILIITPAALFAQDVSIWDFRIPETNYQRLTGSLSGGWNKTDYNSTDYYMGTMIPNHTSTSSKYSNVQSELSYDFAHYNENSSLEITAFAMGQANRQSSDGSQSYDAVLSSQASGSQTNYSLAITPLIRYSNYIDPDTWFWFAEGSGDYSFTQNNYDSNTIYPPGSSNTSYHDSSYYKHNFWNASVTGGIGYGKLRDGSDVFAVLRILDKLTEDSVLIRPLTKEEVLRIVDIFARKAEYSYTQDRFVKYFMEDIFGQLQKMGVLKDTITTAYSVLRAVEVLSEQIEPRLFGWRARIGIKRTYMETINAMDESESSYPAFSSEYFWYVRDNVSMALEYGYPLSLNLDVRSSFSVEIPFTDYQRKIAYTYQLAGIYQIGERIDATISGSISRTISQNQSAEENEFIRSVQYNAGVSFRFFIENNVNVKVSCGYSELHQDQFSHFFPGSSVYTSVNQYPSISFGVSYRFL